MTHKQLQKKILHDKGDSSWRDYGEALGVAYQDLWSAANSDAKPKSGILLALGIEAITETRYQEIAK